MRLAPAVTYGRCGHPVASYKGENALCFACEDAQNMSPSWYLPIGALLMELTCREIEMLGVCGHDTAARIKRGERRLTVVEALAFEVALAEKEREQAEGGDQHGISRDMPHRSASADKGESRLAQGLKRLSHTQSESRG